MHAHMVYTGFKNLLFNHDVHTQNSSPDFYVCYIGMLS